MKAYVVKGKLSTNGKTVEKQVDALEPQEVWNNPEDFGFDKVFKVTEARKIKRERFNR